MGDGSLTCGWVTAQCHQWVTARRPAGGGPLTAGVAGRLAADDVALPVGVGRANSQVMAPDRWDGGSPADRRGGGPPSRGRWTLPAGVGRANSQEMAR
ncbi:hypothetical protein GCM10010244_06380 [Streptomyces coeruleorubidus]|nr:hypothetical protein GCM10010244_06380 [Streptomyces bellus]